MSRMAEYPLAASTLHVGRLELHGEDFGRLQRASKFRKSYHKKDAHICGRYALFQAT